jgi:glutathione S-transferase
LMVVHPLGKSPVITDDELVIHESAAIVDYLINRYGNGALQPPRGTRDYVKYMEWMHYAEGSAMLPLLLGLYTGRLGDAAAPLAPRIQSELDNHFSFMNDEMEGREYFVGNNLTGADIMLSFPLEGAKTTGVMGEMPNLAAFVDRMQARPAYRVALEKGGAYAYGPRD